MESDRKGYRMSEYSKLQTEQRNERTTHIDEASPAEIVRLMNEENRRAVEAVGDAENEIAAAIDGIARRIEAGGRLIYVGAGTSGRLGALDAAECPPTFGVGYDEVVAVMAGGKDAFFRAAEGAEDSAEAGERDIAALGITENDSVVGISAAGGAQYVISAVKYAKARGALTVSITCNPGTPLAAGCDIAIECLTGAEALTGSTRLKAGTAQKLVLNMLSTGAMIRTGKVYENMMINVRPTNVKLKDRAARIAAEVSGADYDAACKAVEKTGSVKEAIKLLKGSSDA